MSKSFKFSVIIGSALVLSACGSKGDAIVFDTVLGPETEVQIEGLPSTLEGDTARANYSTENLKGQQMESDDGSTR
ncbi:lipoprotein [Kordiimonas aquimaris]|uniref:lipoprotein n=1 Tax=Kordiimonas aquimaris TaxID=707591 RepID=UPI0021D16AC7|nr:lipoprotein [Kordiimonas aquimaris]